MKRIVLDTETTGLDLFHGARPYLVTTAEGEFNMWWEWNVDPLTRRPQVPEKDLRAIQVTLDEADELVLQNAKFDYLGLALTFEDAEINWPTTVGRIGDDEGMRIDRSTKWGNPFRIGLDGTRAQVVQKYESWLQDQPELMAALPELRGCRLLCHCSPRLCHGDVLAELAGPQTELRWDWGKVRDTLLAGHLLASNHPHDLTTMVLVYLGVNIDPLDRKLEHAVKEAAKIAKGSAGWQLAKAGRLDMPSVKGKAWKLDAWLPRAVARQNRYAREHPWWKVCSEYANGDSASTLALYGRQEELLEERGLTRLYRERLKILPTVCGMQTRGVTLNRERLGELEQRYGEDVEETEQRCKTLAGDEDLKLPKSGANNALKRVLFDTLGLHSNKRTKSSKTHPRGQLSVDASVLEHWLATLPRRGRGRLFVQSLTTHRKRQTALSYLKSYRKFWLPLEARDSETGCGYDDGVWWVLHSSLNPTGTATLRWSNQNPNLQQVSKQEETNLRYCFGPAPGREWWSMDAKNLELRIPAYEADEREMIDLFERPNDPPYFGSYHLLVFDTLHPQRFAEYGADCKKQFAATWYQWTKNGNFAVQYGAVEQSGTADRAYHVPGAQHKIQDRFKKIAGLNWHYIRLAERQGYVETMPDKTVDPKRGYPLLCTRSRWGGILPTVPFNYHVQGTACWWMTKAMIRVQAYLDTLPDHHMIMQVHDELVFDFPKRTIRGVRTTTDDDGIDPERDFLKNLPKIRKIQRLMEQGGEDISVPTPVSVEYHPETWSEGITV